jgi:4-amino-4-deoxy-L-arabinose transferase-like glycosyltransferase
VTGFLALHALGLLSVVLAAWGWGALILRRNGSVPPAEREVLRFGVGLAVLSYSTFVLGLFGALSRGWLLVLVIVGLVLALRRLARLRHGTIAIRPLPVLIALVFGVPLVLLSLYPPVDWDATAYHLALSKMDLQAHRLIVATYLRYPVFPQFVEMLFTLAMGIYDDIVAQLVSFAMWLGTAVAVYAMGKRIANRATGLVAVGLWVGGPTGLIVGSIGYVDAGVTFFACLAALAWASFAEDRSDRLAALCGGLAGCAAATKYSGLFFVAALGAATCAWASPRRRMRATAHFLGFAALTCLPWYIRNAALSGDPFFPFLGRWIGLRWWNAGDLQRQVSELRDMGTGRSVVSFLLLWGRLAFNQGLFVGPEDVFSPSLWIPLPILLVLLWNRPRERTLLWIAFVFLGGWFFYSQGGRYLLPVIPFLCVGMGVVLARWLSALPRGARAAIWATAILVTLPSVWYGATLSALRGLPPVTPAGRSRFIENLHGSYPAYAWLNGMRGTHYRVYAWREPEMAYYAEGKFIGDWFGPARYRDFEAGIARGEEVYRFLRAFDIDYWVVANALGPVRVPDDRFSRTHLPLAYNGPGARVYAVVADSTSASPGRDPGPTQIDFQGSLPR